eukprot:678449-Pyramimonas_sp.AAC.1
MDLPPERRIAYRAQGVGWIKTSIVEIRSATTYPLAGKHKTTIKNMALRTPDERDLNLERDPTRYGPGTPAGATAKATPKLKPEAIIDIPTSSDSSSPSFGPDQLRPKEKRGRAQVIPTLEIANSSDMRGSLLTDNDPEDQQRLPLQLHFRAP